MSLRVLAGAAATYLIASQLPPAGFWHWAALVGWLVGWTGAYWVSLRLHPMRDCRSCRGSGAHRGLLFTRARRPCRDCSGSGATPRRVAKVLGFVP